MKQLATYSYLSAYRNNNNAKQRRQLGNLKEHVKETESEANRILREANGISSKQNVGQEEVRIKIKIFETCLSHQQVANGFEAWLGQNTKVRWKRQKKYKISY